MADLEYLVTQVSTNGGIVALSDGSKYFIYSGDGFKCSRWFPNQRILIKEGNKPTYEFTLTNLDTAGPDIVKAHRI